CGFEARARSSLGRRIRRRRRVLLRLDPREPERSVDWWLAASAGLPRLPAREVSSGARGAGSILRLRSTSAQGTGEQRVDVCRPLAKGPGGVHLPFFERHPLVIKDADYRCFAAIARMMRRREHLTASGFERAVRLAFAMNANGKQRTRTPNRSSQDPQRLHAGHGRKGGHEGTVRSSWRHEELGRNDLTTLRQPAECGVTNMPKVAKFLVG